MELKRFALIVENEVFDIIPLPSNDGDEMSARWSVGFANKPHGLDVSQISNCYIGSIWDGSSFDNSNVNPKDIIDLASYSDRYAMLSDNKVFMLLLPTASDKFKQEMYKAAFSTNSVTGIEVTNYPINVGIGWIWDGENFSPPVGTL